MDNNDFCMSALSANGMEFMRNDIREVLLPPKSAARVLAAVLLASLMIDGAVVLHLRVGLLIGHCQAPTALARARQYLLEVALEIGHGTHSNEASLGTPGEHKQLCKLINHQDGCKRFRLGSGHC